MTDESKRTFNDYGYVAVALAGLELFEMSARRFGRTERLIAAVRDGDRVICSSTDHQRDLKRRLRDAGKPNVTVVVSDPRRGAPLGLVSAKRCRTFFDHPYVLERVRLSIRGAGIELAEWEKEMSRDPAPQVEERTARNFEPFLRGR
jgi:hypothetical protein